MMQRLFHVTSGYLKFTFASMLAATVAFSLVGLAVTAPQIFLIVIAVAIAVFFVVRMEVNTHRHARELGKKNHPEDQKIDAKAWAQYLAFAEAATVLISGLNDDIRIRKPSAWVSEWLYINDPKPDHHTTDQTKFEKAKMMAAIKAIKFYQKDLEAQGLHIISVSKTPAEDILSSIRTGKHYVHLRTINQKPKNERPLTLVFIRDSDVPLRLEVIEGLLKTSFQMVKPGDFTDLKSTPS